MDGNSTLSPGPTSLTLGQTINVAIVEDDADLRATLSRFLKSVGMNTLEFGNVGDLGIASGETLPEIVVLDVNLPGENGFIAAARMRALSMVGIIMLTGRTGQEDRLLGLSMGVDHYLGKPVDLRELESVIRNLARRLSSAKGKATAPSDSDKPIWTLNKDEWRLIAPNGSIVELSAAEYQALGPIIEQPGRPNSRDTINARLGKPRLDSDNRSLDVLISRIRRKIETTTGQVLPLRSARGTGYVFTGMARVEGSQNS